MTYFPKFKRYSLPEYPSPYPLLFLLLLLFLPETTAEIDNQEDGVSLSSSNLHSRLSSLPSASLALSPSSQSSSLLSAKQLTSSPTLSSDSTSLSSSPSASSSSSSLTSQSKSSFSLSSSLPSSSSMFPLSDSSPSLSSSNFLSPQSSLFHSPVSLKNSASNLLKPPETSSLYQSRDFETLFHRLVRRSSRPYDVPLIECPSSEDGIERFSCPSADRMGRFRCIEDHVLCNGFIDCPNGEDEDRMSCMFYKMTKAHLDVLADALLRMVRGRF